MHAPEISKQSAIIAKIYKVREILKNFQTNFSKKYKNCCIEGSVIDELEKNEAIDKKLLRYLTVRVKKFDLETNYFGKKEDSEKKESIKN